MYTTRKSWSRRRRVVGKAEHLDKGANPRFVVTSLAASEHGARELYEDLYCQRGEMENRIKECQLDLFADRTSAKTMRANQLRLWFASFALTATDDWCQCSGVSNQITENRKQRTDWFEKHLSLIATRILWFHKRVRPPHRRDWLHRCRCH